jgi:DNA-binding NtrC family response regulator
MDVKKKILVVDDEKNNRDLITDYLEEEYAVRTASNLLEFIQAFRHDKPDLVITDYFMRNGETGADVRNWIESENPETPIILTSSMIHLVPKEEKFGFICYLRKPFITKILFEAIRSALHKKEA